MEHELNGGGLVGQPIRNPERRVIPATFASWRLVGVAMLASAWGLSELIGGETVWLTAVALLLLAAARALVNRAGTSTAMAAIAMLFKSVNAAPFLCHLVGIAMLGVAFDIMATLFWREDRKAYLRAALTGATAAYLSCFLFAASLDWVFKYKYWAGGGLGRIGEHTLTSGSRGALMALFLVPAGLWFGGLLVRQAGGRPRLALRAAVVVCLALWLVGPLAD